MNGSDWMETLQCLLYEASQPNTLNSKPGRPIIIALERDNQSFKVLNLIWQWELLKATSFAFALKYAYMMFLIALIYVIH